MTQSVHPVTFIPFALMLLAIALMPFIAHRWWEKHYPKVSIGLGLITLTYYLVWVRNFDRIEHTALEYVGFICLVGSLFVVAGGIIIRVKGEATPVENVILLAAGALLANVIGTAGASMLLIRPFIRMNRYRITGYHIVFFIFIVSNVGGCLTPIGDPPLFLGYLKGIPFFWVVEHMLFIWLFGIGWLLSVFFVVDRINFSRAPMEIRQKETPTHGWKVEGLRNLFFLAVILMAVFIQKPIFMREVLMILAALGSYYLTRATKPDVHRDNEFNFMPLREVAWLFVGIFCTMMPVLDWLAQGSQGGSSSGSATGPGAFYWGTGVLSAVLDNAPTYLSFLYAAIGAFVDPQHIAFIQDWVRGGMTASLDTQPAEVVRTVAALKQYHAGLLAAGEVPLSDIQVCYLIGNTKFNAYIVAISAGAVFFGAMTYIGNAPNFMVKTISEHQKVDVPSFFGYLLKYALPVLLPMLAAVWWFFFS
jgi:Na+/H+ antiporter NhaD/arsenite permease-like protein